MIFKIFFCVSDFWSSLVKLLCFEETDGKCLKYVETHSVIGRGVFSLPIGWKPGRKCARRVSTVTVFPFPKVSPLHFPKCLHSSESIAEKVFHTLRAFPKESPIPFSCCSNGLQELLGAFPNMTRHRFGHFLHISLKAACFFLLWLKIKDTTEKLKNHQWFFCHLWSIGPYHL